MILQVGDFAYLTCRQIPLHGGDGGPGAMLGRCRVVILRENFAIRKPEVTSGLDLNVPPLVVLDDGPVVEAEMVPVKHI